MIKQLSIFIENKQGRLSEITRMLADNNINIHAISIADTTDFGILRLIVHDPVNAANLLKERGLTIKMTEVLAVALENRPGALADVLEELGKYDVGIEYMYAFTSKNLNQDGMVILRLTNQDEAFNKISDCKIRLLSDEDLKNIQ